MFSLVQLEYLIAVDTYGQFSIAAEKCFVTQPTLSMQIKKMESDLDIVIFDRSKQPVVATELGKTIIEQARVVLSESSKINELIKSQMNEVSGELRIGIIPSVAPYLLPLIVGPFTKQFPEVQLKISEMLTEQIVDALDKETIDLGIASTPVPHKNLKETVLYFEEILIYCHDKHPLFGNKSISSKDLARENIWLLSQGHCFRSQALNVCELKENAKTTPFEYESASIETLIKMVDKEGGITLIPELAVNDLSPAKQKRVRAIDSLKPVREISIVTNRLFVKNQALEAMKACILSQIPEKLKSADRGNRVEWN
ncbi:MAG: LysR substrate-binding domain-containing protein [Crocinitomicaceae bacterium]